MVKLLKVFSIIIYVYYDTKFTTLYISDVVLTDEYFYNFTNASIAYRLITTYKIISYFTNSRLIIYKSITSENVCLKQVGNFN